MFIVVFKITLIVISIISNILSYSVLDLKPLYVLGDNNNNVNINDNVNRYILSLYGFKKGKDYVN